jgi:uncharacterized protein YbjT (DUF2867 family)
MSVDVDEIAAAIAAAGANNPDHWNRINERTRHTYRRMARAAANIIEQKGETSEPVATHGRADRLVGRQF